MKTFGEHILSFYEQLEIPEFPAEIEPLLPFRTEEVKHFMSQFYMRYYHDHYPRILLFGINPGRLGAGKTGVGFTDPVRLKEECGIDHQLEMKTEPSSVFMYNMIHGFGGTNHFFGHFHFTSVCPVGFTKKGINFNYYDTPELLKASEPFIKRCIAQQVLHPVNPQIAFCIGKGRNYKYLTDLNKKYQWFEQIKALPHPRWVIQYQHKYMQLHIEQYVKELSAHI